MFDTHCHLNIKPLYENHLDVIKNARENGVSFFLIPGMNIKDSKVALNIANDFENVYASIGIHPTEDLEKININKIEEVFNELIENNENIVAIGETGLDFYKYLSPINLQVQVLRFHIKLASKHGLGLILHNRMATNYIIKELEKGWSPSFSGKIVFHCCPPEKELLTFAKEKEIFIGVDGDITYDKEKEDFIKEVPLELLVLETDSPNLTPLPIRNENKFPNKPENLKYVAKHISKIKDINEKKLIKITTRNSKRLFDIM